jgi:hypothetical protein
MSNQEFNETNKIATSGKTAKVLLLMTIIAFVIMSLVFGSYFFHFHGDLSSQQENWGTFGDYIGGTLNPILSFLSLIALLWTIRIQSKDIELTLIELNRSASAQEETKKILDKQSETLARQQFESTFFSLLEQHNKALEFLSIHCLNKSTTPLIISIHNEVFFGEGVGSLMAKGRPANLGIAKNILERKNAYCGHYFRILYQLLKFIATNVPGSTIGQAFEVNKITHTEASVIEKMYSNIVRSFLGYQITQLLAVNCYCKLDNSDTHWKYKLLIERYAFLEHMPFEVNNVSEHNILAEAKNYYEDSAFDNSDFVNKSE